jgi:hypothetical protein
MMTGFCQTTETDNPDIDSLFSTSRGGHDDDGTGSQSGDGRGHNSKDKGRGSYKCGRVSTVLNVFWSTLIPSD